MDERLWIFDLDNTLVATPRSYGYAIVEFIRLMLDVFSWRAPYWITIVELISEIDNKRVDDYGGARHRFPGSLVICYWRLCEQVGMPKDGEITFLVRRIGESAFSWDFYRQDQLIPGVEETFNFLKAQGDDLLILTRGDPDVQWLKWEGYDLGRWFPTEKEFRVIRWEPIAGYPGDKGKELAKLRKEYPERGIYSVGDSIRSDIVPAAEAEMIPIYIPAYSRWDRGLETPSLPDETIVLKKIAEIIERYDEL